MRRIGDLLTDLGFKKDSDRDVQEAFVRHLVRHAESVSPQNSCPIPKQNEGEKQLSFDLEVLGTQTPPRSNFRK